MRESIEMDRGQQMAMFRSEIIGALLHRELSRGELQNELRELSQHLFRPPGSERTRTFSVATLERWLYAYKHKGLAGLHPKPRRDRGRGRNLPPELKTLLLDIRREHTQASVPLILRTLVLDGRLQKDLVSPATVRRLYCEHGLDCKSAPPPGGSHTRLRWETSSPNVLWHADVCHGPTLQIAGAAHPLRIHALLDDCSRFVVCIAAFDTEREDDMLRLLCRALRAHGRPDALYLDNGATYTGDLLRAACGKLGINLLHAKPYDPQARGKMERFWRTLRQGCLAFLPTSTTFAQVQQHLDTFLQSHYQHAPHASLLGKSPAQVYYSDQQLVVPVDEPSLREALTVRLRRRVRCDTTVSFLGQLFELEQGYLAKKVITIGYCLLDGGKFFPWAEYEHKRLVLHPCDPRLNSRRRRKGSGAPQVPPLSNVPFNPCAKGPTLADPHCPSPSEDTDDDDDLSDIF